LSEYLAQIRIEIELLNFETVLRALKKFRPKKIFVAKGSDAEHYSRLALQTTGTDSEIVLFPPKGDFSIAKKFNYKRRIPELSKKTRALLKRSVKKGPVVLFRSRGYFEKLKQEFEKESEFSVFSMDEAFIADALNPKRWIGSQKKNREHLRNIFSCFAASGSVSKKLAYKKIGLMKICPWVFSRLFSEFEEYCRAIDSIFRVFEKQGPVAVLLWNDNLAIEKAIVLIARLKKVPSIVLQHGIFASLRKEIKGYYSGYIPVFAGNICVWGPAEKDILEWHNVPGSKIIVTGNPKFDSFRAENFSEEETRKKLGIGKKEKVIMIATQESYVADFKSASEKIIRIAKKIGNTRVLIRPHPLEYPETYKKIAEVRNSNAVVDRDSLLPEQLNLCSVLVTSNSTVGLEAMVFGKPVVIFDPNNKADFYKGTKGAVKTGNIDGLENAVKKALADGPAMKRARKLFTEAHAFKADGKTGQRIIELVREKTLCNKKGIQK